MTDVALAGVLDDEPRADDPVMLYYNAAGKRVKDADAAAKQYLSNDPARPDASPEEREGVGPFRLGPAADKPIAVYYYDADGNRTSEPVSGGKQYTADDPARPDADEMPASDSAKAQKSAANKARTSSDNK